MGTRGAFGFFKDGKTIVTFNHYDSYPSGLGVTMVKYCQNHSIDEMRDLFDRFVEIEDKELDNGSIVNGIDLRELQGNPDLWHSISGDVPVLNSEGFLQDSLFCEWAYIINLNEETLEVYKGFQKELDINSSIPNRYCTKHTKPVREMKDLGENYYPVGIVKVFDLKEVKKEDMEEFGY